MHPLIFVAILTCPTLPEEIDRGAVIQGFAVWCVRCNYLHSSSPSNHVAWDAMSDAIFREGDYVAKVDDEKEPYFCGIEAVTSKRGCLQVFAYQ